MHASTIHEFAPAKINLYLHVLGRRADGYHNLDSLVVFASQGDNLTLKKSSHYSLEVTGPFASSLMASVTGPNLVLQAADVVSHCVKEIPPGGEISLEKNLPISSGIGGGSSDAAACVRALLKLHNQKISDVARQQIALAIGSDVSVCLLAKATRMTGAGHSLDPLNTFPQIDAVLVNPGVKISTADVFKALQLEKGSSTGKAEIELPPGFKSVETLCYFLGETSNDLQETAMRQVPLIRNVLEELSQQDKCLLARMSGSGATCFGLFQSQSSARAAASKMKQKHPDWWVVETKLS